MGTQKLLPRLRLQNGRVGNTGLDSLPSRNFLRPVPSPVLLLISIVSDPCRGRTLKIRSNVAGGTSLRDTQLRAPPPSFLAPAHGNEGFSRWAGRLLSGPMTVENRRTLPVTLWSRRGLLLGLEAAWKGQTGGLQVVNPCGGSCGPWRPGRHVGLAGGATPQKGWDSKGCFLGPKPAP